MENDWVLVRVGEICESVSLTHDLAKERLVFLNTSDILRGKVLHHTYSHVREWPGQAKKAIKRGDILLSEIRPANGRWAYVDFDADDHVVSTKLMVVRANSDRVNPRYLYHFLTCKPTTAWLQHLAEARSGTFPQITFAEVSAIELKLPSLEIQAQIAEFLDSLGRRIELSGSVSQTLEEIARALFKSWFVDFDPVRAKAEGRDTGLPREIADLFPDEFEDSELGEIPKGWGIAGLDQIAEFLNGLPLQKYPPNGDDSLPVIKIAQLRAGNSTGADQAGTNVPTGYVVDDGDILFSWSGSLLCVLWAGGRGALNQHIYKVTSTTHPRWFFFGGIQQHLDEFRGIAAGKATTMGHIQRKHLASAKLAIPPLTRLEKLGEIIEPIFESQWRRRVESRCLCQLRDSLLPRLISGELRVKNAESKSKVIA